MARGDGHPGYLKLLEEMAELHKEKAKGYGSDEDPLDNLRRSERLGVAAWKGALLRGGDKWARIEKHATGNELPFESFEQDLMDFAAYLLLTLVLLREEKRNAEMAKAIEVDQVNDERQAEWELKQNLKRNMTPRAKWNPLTSQWDVT